MLNLILGFIVLYGLKSNIVVSFGPGAMLMAREKQYAKFRAASSLLLMLGTILCLIISYFLNKYVYKPNDMFYLSTVISVLIVGLYNILVSKIFSKMSNFMHYLYEKSYTFAIDFVFIMSLIFVIDMSLVLVDFIVMAAVIGVVMFISNMLFGFYIEDANKSHIDKTYLNVPSRLFILAIFSMLLYYAGMLII